MPRPTWDSAPLILAALALVATGALATYLTMRGRHGSNGQRQEQRGTLALRLAAVAATVCTIYSADTSWRFAAHHLGMYSTAERIVMFAAGELALLSTALLARANLHSDKRAPGMPGVMVWVITTFQIIPAYAESGLVGGTVRAVLGPVLAAVLWHLALGIELRHRIAKATSNSLAARIGREVRERLLSRLGIADRSRDAQEITRERATTKAAALAARLHAKPTAYRTTWRGQHAMRRLSDALDRAQVATDPQQRERLLARFAARRNAAELLDADLAFPWETGTRRHAASAPSGLPTSGDSTSGIAQRSHDHPPPARERVPEVPTPKRRQKRETPQAKREPPAEPEPPHPVPERDTPKPRPRRTGRPPDTSIDELIAIARDLEARTGSAPHTAMRTELDKLDRKASNKRITQALDALEAERNGGTSDLATPATSNGTGTNAQRAYRN
ncbi:hypothetical protein AB5J49_38680 [Streptomyces sp. R28]|uniref:DUF2637 domain-containing protein n=1 Tax=Streptomyces sp. R28 TaxID=3238628 RepID=A0AB39Q901_9ACTN